MLIKSASDRSSDIAILQGVMRRRDVSGRRDVSRGVAADVEQGIRKIRSSEKGERAAG